MSTISQFPRGLLGVLGLKDFGQTPKDFASVVSGVINTEPFYLLNTLEVGVGVEAAPVIGSNLLSAASVGGFVDLSQGVPNGEVWYLHAYDIQVNPGAGTAITLQPAVRYNNARMAFAPPLVCTGAAGPPFFIAPFGATGIWLPPSTRFGFQVTSITGAPGSVEGVAWLSRFKA